MVNLFIYLIYALSKNINYQMTIFHYLYYFYDHLIIYGEMM